jgi:hypothetical protein
MFLCSLVGLWSLPRGEEGDGRYCASPKATALCFLDSQSAHTRDFRPPRPLFQQVGAHPIDRAALSGLQRSSVPSAGTIARLLFLTAVIRHLWGRPL